MDSASPVARKSEEEYRVWKPFLLGGARAFRFELSDGTTLEVLPAFDIQAGYRWGVLWPEERRRSGGMLSVVRPVRRVGGTVGGTVRILDEDGDLHTTKTIAEAKKLAEAALEKGRPVMTGPTSIDEIPWSDGEPEAERLQLSKPRVCKHPRPMRRTVVVEPPYTETIEECSGCGHRFDPAIQRRGRAVRKYGKTEELVDARMLGLEPRGTSRDQEDSGGALDPAVVQSKTGPIHYPSASWIAELDALGRVAQGRPRILVATPKLGRGVRRRKVAVLYLDELQALTELRADRKILEEIARLAARAVTSGDLAELAQGIEAIGGVDRWKR